jgi:2-methylisocitrate lyase-like PEP mutase family enzyme
VQLCVETGVAGLSIEDTTGDDDAPLHDLPTATARLRAARAAIDAAGGGVVLTARAENFVAGRPDLDDAIRRLVAYAEAGADCLYAPGLTTRAQMATVVRAVAPKPVNVLVSSATDLTVADLAALGVRRVSLGSSLARAAWGAFLRAARDLASTGRFDALADAATYGELNDFFSADVARRRR